MTVISITVDGIHDMVVDVDNTDAWSEASTLVHEALAGRPVTVSATERPELTVTVDSLVINWAKQVVVADD
jgi:hypothetical protein